MRQCSENMKWVELRKLAETILHERSATAKTWEGVDLLHLIHELEIHQMELEIQGDELRLKTQELKELLHRYSDLYQNAPTGFVNLDTQGIIVEANHAAFEMLGSSCFRSPKDLKNIGFSRFIHLEDHKRYYEVLKELSRVPGGKGRGELRLLKDFSAPFFAQLEIVPMKNVRNELEGWLVVFMDISRRLRTEESLQAACTELEQSRERLKNLSARLIKTQEEERRRIARELHDSFGQTLAAMKFSIENALENRNRHHPEEAFQLLEHLIPSIQGAIEEVRNIYTGLRPTILDDLGILATLNWFCRQFRTTLPNVHMETVLDIDEKDVPEHLKIVVFRIVQEALNNVTKHSRAEWVDLSLGKQGADLVLTIEDNGVGFDVAGFASEPYGPRMGLMSMRERVELSDGSFTITSTKGQGTVVEAKWKI